MTSRELALEAAVRFTDRNKFAIDTMLKNADKIEAWLNRDLPKSQVMGNPIHKIAVAYHEYGKEHGRLPTRVYCHPDTLIEIGRHIGDEAPGNGFQFAALKVEADDSLAPDELKFS
jgi:hypothetical protein